MNETSGRLVDLGVSRRLGYLGGSDSPVVLGVSPFTTRKELWRDKMGLVEKKEETPAMKRGKILESIVAELYSLVKNRPLEIVQQKIIHPEYPFIAAHIDRRIFDPAMPNRGPGVWECKCPSMGVFNKCKREGLQEYYIVQMQHYLGVTGYKWGAFAIFSAELWELLEFDVVPDKELIKLIFQEDEKFWKLIEWGIEPEDDRVEIEMEPVGQSELVNMDKINPDLWGEMTKRYQEADQLFDDAKVYLELCEQKIKDEMERAGAAVAEGSGARIYWRDQVGKMSLNKEAFATASPEAYKIYESFLKRGKPSRPFRAFFPRKIIHE